METQEGEGGGNTIDVLPPFDLPQPTRETVPLSLFVTNGVLAEDLARAVLEVQRRWTAIDDLEREGPHVLVLDFQGVDSFPEGAVNDFLLYSLSAIHKAKNREGYVILDHVKDSGKKDIPFSTINAALRKAKLVAVARRDGKPNFELIGDQAKIQKYKPLWDSLATWNTLNNGQWVNGGPFAERALGIKKMNRARLLNQAYEDGIVVKSRFNPYYHSLAA